MERSILSTPDIKKLNEIQSDINFNIKSKCSNINVVERPLNTKTTLHIFFTKEKRKIYTSENIVDVTVKVMLRSEMSTDKFC